MALKKPPFTKTTTEEVKIRMLLYQRFNGVMIRLLKIRRLISTTYTNFLTTPFSQTFLPLFFTKLSSSLVIPLLLTFFSANLLFSSHNPLYSIILFL